MKKKILIIGFAAALLGIVILSQWLSYPPAWDDVNLYQSKDEVYQRTGPPTVDTHDIKGAFWYREKFGQYQELWVFFDEDNKVKYFAVHERFGTKDNFIRRGIRGGFDPQPER